MCSAGRCSALCWDERFATHDMGRGAMYLPIEGLIEDDLHVDNTARIVRTRNLIRAAGLDDALRVVAPREATVDEILRVHSREHVERMEAESERGRGDAGGGYTPMDGRSYGLALLSAGSALTALELVLSGETQTAHAMLRRSGHHASRDSGYGFCIFNNCAIAAAAAREQFGLDRVAIVDIDAHHGNGTEAIFLAEPGVLTISIQQDRSFPVETGSVETVGEGAGEGRNVNVNLPAGTGDPGYHYAVDRIVAPVLRRVRAAARGGRLRRRREPVRPALAPGRHGRGLRRHRRTAARSRRRGLSEQAGLGAGGRLQPRLRALLLARRRRDDCPATAARGPL